METEIVRLLIHVRPVLLLTLGLTMVFYLFLLLCIRRMRIQGQGTRLAGLFVGLGGRSALHLGCAWLKFAFLTSCLVLAQPAQVLHYLLLFALTAVTLLAGFSVDAILTEVAGEGMLLAGLAVCSTLMNYLRQIRRDDAVLTAYWLLAAFLILCAACVLVREAAAASGERKRFDENGETE